MMNWFPLGPTELAIVVAIILLIFGTDPLHPRNRRW